MRLSDKYRPRKLDEVVGQPACIRQLKALAAKPYSCCILLECPGGGVGKTSTALAFANEIGCEDEFSGLHIVPCSELGIDMARELFDGNTLRLRPMLGSGWHVVVLEEFDWLPPQTQRFLKVALETKLPAKCIVIATSNGAGKLDAPLMQRFRCYAYSSGPTFREAAQERLVEIWQLETGGADLPFGWLNWGVRGETFSLRVALDNLQEALVMIESVAA